jgi:hypothetical protein
MFYWSRSTSCTMPTRTDISDSYQKALVATFFFFLNPNLYSARVQQRYSGGHVNYVLRLGIYVWVESQKRRLWAAVGRDEGVVVVGVARYKKDYNKAPIPAPTPPAV